MATIQDLLREFPEVDRGKASDELGIPVTLEDGSILPHPITGHPRMGKSTGSAAGEGHVC